MRGQVGKRDNASSCEWQYEERQVGGEGPAQKRMLMWERIPTQGDKSILHTVESLWTWKRWCRGSSDAVMGVSRPQRPQDIQLKGQEGKTFLPVTQRIYWSSVDIQPSVESSYFSSISEVDGVNGGEKESRCDRVLL